MAGKARRYIELIWLFIKFDYFVETAYTANFIAASLGKVTRVALSLVFFHALSVAVPGIPKWNELALFILVATFYIVDLIASIFFQRNILFHLPKAIRDGSLDRILVKPIHTLFHVSMQRIDIGDTIALIPFGFFWWYVWDRFQFQPSMLAVGAYVLCLFIALAATYGMVLILGSLSFWTVKSEGFGRFIDYISAAAIFPITLFPQQIQVLFFYVIPIALFAFIPTQALLGSLTWSMLIYAITATTLLLCVGAMVWSRGLQQYQSASS